MAPCGMASAFHPPPRSLLFGFQQLDVYHLAVRFVAFSSNVITALPPGHSSIAEQFRRAALSIPLNIAEGSGRMRATDAARHYAIARGSALECAAILDVCEALAVVPAERLEDGRSMVFRVVQMLSKMCG